MLGWETEIRREFPGYSLDYQEPGETGIRILSSSGSWSGNLFDFYLQVYARVSRDFPAGSPVRQALREALVNALTHADYYDRRGLVIQRLPNQIRIANPGAFRVDVREALAGGVSDPRNAVLIRLFRLIGAGGGQGGPVRNSGGMAVPGLAGSPNCGELWSGPHDPHPASAADALHRRFAAGSYRISHRCSRSLCWGNCRGTGCGHPDSAAPSGGYGTRGDSFRRG